MVHPVINCCLWVVVGTISSIHREMSASNGHADDGMCAECYVDDDSLQAIMAFMFCIFFFIGFGMVYELCYEHNGIAMGNAKRFLIEFSNTSVR